MRDCASGSGRAPGDRGLEVGDAARKAAHSHAQRTAGVPGSSELAVPGRPDLCLRCQLALSRLSCGVPGRALVVPAGGLAGAGGRHRSPHRRSLGRRRLCTCSNTFPGMLFWSACLVFPHELLPQEWVACARQPAKDTQGGYVLQATAQLQPCGVKGKFCGFCPLAPPTGRGVGGAGDGGDALGRGRQRLRGRARRARGRQLGLIDLIWDDAAIRRLIGQLACGSLAPAGGGTPQRLFNGRAGRAGQVQNGPRMAGAEPAAGTRGLPARRQQCRLRHGQAAPAGQGRAAVEQSSSGPSNIS